MDWQNGPSILKLFITWGLFSLHVGGAYSALAVQTNGAEGVVDNSTVLMSYQLPFCMFRV